MLPASPFEVETFLPGVLGKIVEEWPVEPAAMRQVDLGELNAVAAVGLDPVQDFEGSELQRMERITVHSDFEGRGRHLNLKGRKFKEKLITLVWPLSKSRFGTIP
jgi:hypothetical protein